MGLVISVSIDEVHTLYHVGRTYDTKRLAVRAVPQELRFVLVPEFPIHRVATDETVGHLHFFSSFFSYFGQTIVLPKGCLQGYLHVLHRFTTLPPSPTSIPYKLYFVNPLDKSPKVCYDVYVRGTLAIKCSHQRRCPFGTFWEFRNTRKCLAC